MEDGVVFRLFESRRVFQYLVDVLVQGPAKVGERECVGGHEPDEPLRKGEECVQDEGKVLGDTRHAV